MKWVWQQSEEVLGGNADGCDELYKCVYLQIIIILIISESYQAVNICRMTSVFMQLAFNEVARERCCSTKTRAIEWEEKNDQAE